MFLIEASSGNKRVILDKLKYTTQEEAEKAKKQLEEKYPHLKFRVVQKGAGGTKAFRPPFVTFKFGGL